VLTFLIRRTLASIAVLAVASYLVYVLAAISGNPLGDLIQSRSPNKAELIAQRVALLNLNVPPYLRYFIWLGGLLKGFVGQFSLGNAINGQSVTSELWSAAGVTLTLVTGATIIAIIVGLTIGITTALRQYSAYDYTATFVSFLFFSLPIFWIAVMLKQFGAIGFNNFLSDPQVSPVWIVILSLLSGVIWMGIIGGNTKRRLVVFGVATLAAAVVLIYITVTKWLDNPSLGPVVTTVLSLGAAYLITVLSTGWANKKARNTALTMAGVGLVLYYPLEGDPYGLLHQNNLINWGTIILFAIVMCGIGALAGYFWGGVDRNLSIRTGIITGFVVTLILLLDRFMQSWQIYATQVALGRPIATIGSSSANLVADYWITGIDNFTHLLLPTMALILASIAGYSRYSRSSLLDVMNQDYIRTARAKGLTERTVVVRHAVRNALIPVTTVITLDFGALIGGAVITETVFSWTGMGALFQQAINQVDVNPIMGVFLVTAIAAVVFNVIADLIYSALDPRIRVSA
jgi:peptide/nickel transport system permease protein